MGDRPMAEKPTYVELEQRVKEFVMDPIVLLDLARIIRKVLDNK